MNLSTYLAMKPTTSTGCRHGTECTCGHLTLSQLQGLWETMSVSDLDYRREKRRLQRTEKPAEAMSRQELKKGLRGYKSYTERRDNGLSTTTERLVKRWTAARQKATQVSRLKDALDVAVFAGDGASFRNVRDIVGERLPRIAPSPPFTCYRTVFLSLVDLERDWRRIPRPELDYSIVVVDAQPPWLFTDIKPGTTELFDARYFAYDDDFKELIRDKLETGLLFWFQPDRNFEALAEFFAGIENPISGERYKPLQLREHWWHRDYGTPVAPRRFAPSRDRVLSNVRSGSFEYNAVMELIYQSNPGGVEPMVAYRPFARRDFLVGCWKRTQIADKMRLYPSRSRASIVRMVNGSGALRLFKKGLILAPPPLDHGQGAAAAAAAAAAKKGGTPDEGPGEDGEDEDGPTSLAATIFAKKAARLMKKSAQEALAAKREAEGEDGKEGKEATEGKVGKPGSAGSGGGKAGKGVAAAGASASGAAGAGGQKQASQETKNGGGNQSAVATGGATAADGSTAAVDPRDVKAMRSRLTGILQLGTGRKQFLRTTDRSIFYPQGESPNDKQRWKKERGTT